MLLGVFPVAGAEFVHREIGGSRLPERAGLGIRENSAVFAPAFRGVLNAEADITTPAVDVDRDDLASGLLVQSIGGDGFLGPWHGAPLLAGFAEPSAKPARSGARWDTQRKF